MLFGAMTTQLSRRTSSRRRPIFGPQKISDLFKSNTFLPINTGAEAAEQVVKLSRRRACEKGVQIGKAILLRVKENFHGRGECRLGGSFYYLPHV
jgi:acetylornithine/succinyldiaminopimelate/putrescine aminotransferase